jgi:hypothetical protein
MPVGARIDDDFIHKLGLKSGQRLSLVRPPNGWADALAEVDDVSVSGSAVRARKANVILVWLAPADDLHRTFEALERKIPVDGAVWAIIPKKSALAKGECAVEWTEMQAAGLASGRLVDNKELRFDDRYYGTRFVVRREKR